MYVYFHHFSVADATGVAFSLVFSLFFIDSHLWSRQKQPAKTHSYPPTKNAKQKEKKPPKMLAKIKHNKTNSLAQTSTSRSWAKRRALQSRLPGGSLRSPFRTVLCDSILNFARLREIGCTVGSRAHVWDASYPLPSSEDKGVCTRGVYLFCKFFVMALLVAVNASAVDL